MDRRTIFVVDDAEMYASRYLGLIANFRRTREGMEYEGKDVFQDFRFTENMQQ